MPFVLRKDLKNFRVKCIDVCNLFSSSADPPKHVWPGKESRKQKLENANNY